MLAGHYPIQTYSLSDMNLSSVISSGRIVDVMVLFIVIEVVALIVYWLSLIHI